VAIDIHRNRTDGSDTELCDDVVEAPLHDLLAAVTTNLWTVVLRCRLSNSLCFLPLSGELGNYRDRRHLESGIGLVSLRSTVRATSTDPLPRLASHSALLVFDDTEMTNDIPSR